MAHDPAATARISVQSYEPSWEPASLFPRTGGEARVWQRDLPESPHGEYWTPSSSGFRNGAAASLSSVLEPAQSIPPKFYLSPKACAGILRRAEKRGKELPADAGAGASLALDGEGNGTYDTFGCLNAHHSSHNRGAVVAFQEVGKRTGKSTTDVRAGIGISEPGGPMYTLQAGAQHGVMAFSPLQGGRTMPVTAECPTLEAETGNKAPVVLCLTGDVTHALTHEGHDASEDGTGRGTPVVVAALTTKPYADNESQETRIVVGTLDAREHGGGFPGSDGAMSGHVQAPHGIPRRLTPLECERLMAWPDYHTLVPDAKGKLLSDAARYKTCGNGVASVHTHWIGWRLASALNGAA